jgi:hypothetical protein
MFNNSYNKYFVNPSICIHFNPQRPFVSKQAFCNLGLGLAMSILNFILFFEKKVENCVSLKEIQSFFAKLWMERYATKSIKWGMLGNKKKTKNK